MAAGNHLPRLRKQLPCQKLVLCNVRWEDSHHRRTAVAHPEPTKAFLKLCPETASHAVCTLQVHPPTSPYPALSADRRRTYHQLIDIAGSGITRSNFHAGYIWLHPGKGSHTLATLTKMEVCSITVSCLRLTPILAGLSCVTYTLQLTQCWGALVGYKRAIYIPVFSRSWDSVFSWLHT